MLPSTVTTKQIQRLDAVAIERYGIPSIVLMENAGRHVAEEVIKDLKGKKNRLVCVFCGLGNNAGDGFVAARHLADAGIRTQTFLIGRAQSLKRDAALNYQILRKLKVPIKEVKMMTPAVREQLGRSDIIIDALFGVGLNREIAEPFKSVIEVINQSRKRIISVDVPSGLDATTGNIYGVCVKAVKTVTFTFAKKGFFIHHGPKVVGKIVVGNIGIPGKIINECFQ
ncbi:MAG: NAD(P)H-hydrate epimerase [Candidatus Omnitrophica bacterium]|nr:NAD(P)H-hydrate epimerase [Candidatus Omnitrophota bacterium]